MNDIKLHIELIPKSVWYSNLRSILTKADWDILRKLVYKNANYKCEICGGKGEKHPVECHETFEYDEANHIQKLSYCQALCSLCHEAKHIGLAQIKGNGERARETLKRVNKWNDDQVDKYIEIKFIEWQKRSRHTWILDLKKMADYGMEKYAIFNWRKENIQKHHKRTSYRNR